MAGGSGEDGLTAALQGVVSELLEAHAFLEVPKNASRGSLLFPQTIAKKASKQASAHACMTLLCPLFGPVQGPPWLAAGVAYLRCKFTYARPPGSWQRPRLRPCRQSWSRVLRPVHQLEARGLRRAAQRSGNAGSFKLDGQPASPRGGTRQRHGADPASFVPRVGPRYGSEHRHHDREHFVS